MSSSPSSFSKSVVTYDRATQSLMNEHANRLWHMHRRMHDNTFTKTQRKKNKMDTEFYPTYVMRSPYALSVLAKERAKEREKEQAKLNSLLAGLDLAFDSESPPSSPSQTLTRSLPSSPQTSRTKSPSSSLPSSPQFARSPKSKPSPTPTRRSVARAINFGETTSHALVSTPAPVLLNGTQSIPQKELETATYTAEELLAGDCEEFRQLVINTIVTKKIYRIGELKKFFDGVIDANAHLGVSLLTEIVNDICKLLNSTE
eukprot:Phypoly_transcript_14906.p1 GENE.Phypoly_transcript_14906~~Phypoly_transcript_14906.p1  ORF type:complete len:259 (+),score=33.06 Phypoly_transcript_14906:75-851(+)